jgi:hypothetical protein
MRRMTWRLTCGLTTRNNWSGKVGRDTLKMAVTIGKPPPRALWTLVPFPAHGVLNSTPEGS